MSDIVHFVLGGFWRWLGALVLMVGAFRGIVHCILAMRGYAVVDKDEKLEKR